MNRTKEKSKKNDKPSQLEIASSTDSKTDELLSPFDSGVGLSMSDLSSGNFEEQKYCFQEDLKPKCDSNKDLSSSELDSGCLLDSGLSIDVEEEAKSDSEHTTKTEPTLQITSNILESNPYIFQDADGDTILHLAVLSEDAELALNIISSCPYYLNVLNKLYQSPLHLAVLTEQPKLVRRLVVAGAEVSLQDHRGNTPLHWACSMGNYECLRPLTVPAIEVELQQARLHYKPSLGLYKFKPEITLIRNYEGQTCVHLAAFCGHKVLECLIQCGADINTKDGKSGQTPLHLCVQTQQLSTVSFLLERCKASLNLRNYSQRIPLDLAKLIQRYKPNDSTALAIVKLLRDETKRRQQEITGGLESQGEEEEMEESSSEEDETDSDDD